jgi:glucokinase
VNAPAWAVGIDVGGTKIAGGLVRFPDATLAERELLATRPDRGPDAVLADVTALAERLVRRAAADAREVAGVGLGVPELVDLRGCVTSAQTLDWRGAPLAERLAAIGPVRVEADVRAAALAEARFGAGRPFRAFAFVTVGTGISSTLVLDGKPFAGARGNALVLASSPMPAVCDHCGAPGRLALEDLAAGPALVRRYQRRRPGWAGSAADVLDAAASGDPEAVQVVRSAGIALGVVVAFLVNVLDPEAVIVGGGLGLAGGLYWSAFVEAARQHIWAPTTRGLPLLPAALGADAGVIGAAAGAWHDAIGASD